MTTGVRGLDAGAEGRRVVDRRYDLDQAVLHRDLDAEAAELASGLDLHLLEALGVEVAGMRVEGGEHAVDGVLDQLLVRRFLDIVGADLLEDVAEQPQLLVGVRVVRALGAGWESVGHQECGCQDRKT